MKLFLIIVLIGYLLYKVGFLRFNINTEVGRRNPQDYRRDGHVNVDSSPNKNKDRKGFKGGEYVDYEEVSK